MVGINEKYLIEPFHLETCGIHIMNRIFQPETFLEICEQLQWDFVRNEQSQHFTSEFVGNRQTGEGQLFWSCPFSTNSDEF